RRSRRGALLFTCHGQTHSLRGGDARVVAGRSRPLSGSLSRAGGCRRLKMNSPKPMMTSPFARLGELARAVGTGAVSRAVDAVGERRAAESFARRRRA